MYYPDMSWVAGQRVPPDWRANTPFHATLTLTGTQRGRSAAYFTWVDELGRTFPMFLADMADLVRSGVRIDGGTVRALWTVGKRGQNYGVRLAGAKDESA